MNEQRFDQMFQQRNGVFPAAMRRPPMTAGFTRTGGNPPTAGSDSHATIDMYQRPVQSIAAGRISPPYQQAQPRSPEQEWEHRQQRQRYLNDVFGEQNSDDNASDLESAVGTGAGIGAAVGRDQLFSSQIQAGWIARAESPVDPQFSTAAAAAKQSYPNANSQQRRYI
jgi:hypothetical protein